MKIKNLEELESLLDKDLSWRKKELIYIRELVDNETRIEKSFLLRSGIALLCAHWEGFIKTASNYYVVYVCGLGVKTKDLKENFLALMLKSNIRESGKSEKCSVHTNLVKRIEEKNNSKFFIKYTDDNKIINTNSNLSYDQFTEILNSLALENPYILKQNYIDYNLLKMRHEVVHGEKTDLKISDFNITFNIILDIMNEFREQIINSAENQLYKK